MARCLCVLVLGQVLGGCTSWFFYPSSVEFGNPSEAGIRYRDVYLPLNDSITLHGWLLEPGFGPGSTADPDSDADGIEPKGSIYFLHGNAENISSHVRAVYWLVEAGWEVFALDYRGYGRSQGRPDVPAVFDDIEAGARWLIQHRETRSADSPLVLLGQSLGGSLAVHYLGSARSENSAFDALIVEAAFTTYGEIAQEIASKSALTWLFQWPARWLLSGPYDPVDAIGGVAPRPVLIIHSRDDPIIPFEHGRRLFERAGEPRAFLPTDGPHIGAFARASVRERVLDFLSGRHRFSLAANRAFTIRFGPDPIDN